MPTGYTELLDNDPPVSIERWIMEGLVRAFGVCGAMREEPEGLSEEEIIERFLNDSTVGYHERELVKANKMLEEVDKRTLDKWRESWTAYLEGIEKDNAESVEDTGKRKARHGEAAVKLRKIVARTKDEEVRAIAKFGLEQLELVKSETKPYVMLKPDLEQYVEKAKKDAAWDVDYHIKGLKEAKQRRVERLRAYIVLGFEVRRILVEPPKDATSK